jgi:tetratricopeptide (TPR) repeat protein
VVLAVDSTTLLVAIALTALLSLAAGGAQWLLGLQHVLGIFPTPVPARDLTSTLVNPNHACALMTLGAGAAASLGARSAGRRAGAWVVVALLLVLGCLWSGSRAGIASLGAAVVFALFRVGYRRTAVAGAAVGGGLAAVVLATADVAEKVGAARFIVPMISDHPWLGIGRGSFRSVQYGYSTEASRRSFSHPENIVAQYVVEWGLLIGVAALLIVFVLAAKALLDRQRSHRVWGAAALFGVLLHNLLDFSLENLGVALLWFYLLASFTGRPPRPRSSWWASVALTGLVIASLSASAAMVLQKPSLAEDLERTGADVARGSFDLDELRARSLRHPAHPYFPSSLAYAYERRGERAAAIRWANHALLLAPHYADGYEIAGRLLVRAGHRDQGFELLRRAWRLSDGRSGMNEAIRLARSVEELELSVPRSYSDPDVPDPFHGSMLVRRLRGPLQIKAAELMDRLRIRPPLDLRAARSVAAAAAVTGSTTLALDALEAWPDDQSILRSTLRALAEEDDWERVDLLLDGLEEGEASERLRFELALRRQDLPAAKATLEARSRGAPSPRDREHRVLERARLKAAEGAPREAIEILRGYIRVDPRARYAHVMLIDLLIETGQRQRALAEAADARYRWPRDPEVEARWRRLRGDVP